MNHEVVGRVLKIMKDAWEEDERIMRERSVPDSKDIVDAWKIGALDALALQWANAAIRAAMGMDESDA